jgi:molecular chaperone GrpE
MVTDKEEPQVRVVDRRWWARADSDHEQSGVDDGVRKPTYVEELERQLADKTAQLQTYLTDHRRALDEFEQVKVRIRRDVAREVERGKRAVLAELLEVIDNLDRALAAPASDAAASQVLLRGVELVRHQFLTKLESFGVMRIPALGQRFDAARHEAVSMTPVSDPDQDDVIVAVAREGYTIGDELLRPASVIVGKK